MEAPARISLKDVSFAYPSAGMALEGVSLDVRSGEFIGLLGSNGSGKTTLLGVMDGLLRDYQGSVALDGREMKRLSARDVYRIMGLVFQNPDAQLFGATVREDVAFGPLNMGYSRAEADIRVEAALKSVDMAEFASRSIAHLSFGQKKRVCIAGLLAMGHEILLLDEPTAGLDPMGEYRMMDLLTSLNKEKGVTIVMATHSVELIPVFLSRLFILSKGRLARGGAPEEVFTAPADMAGVKLRLPHIAELIWKMKHEDKVPFDRIPLTIGEARRMLLEKLDA